MSSQFLCSYEYLIYYQSEDSLNDHIGFPNNVDW